LSISQSLYIQDAVVAGSVGVIAVDFFLTRLMVSLGY
jgi:hypothetical protein